MRVHPLLAQEHLDTDAPLEAIVEKLTAIGLEVEASTIRPSGWSRSSSPRC